MGSRNGPTGSPPAPVPALPAGGISPRRRPSTSRPVCERCGAEITASVVAGRSVRHCSWACRRASAVTARAFTCPSCGAEGVAEQGRQLYCSPECRRLAGRTPEVAECVGCGAVARLTYRAGDALCCSARCARTARRVLRERAEAKAGVATCSRCRRALPLAAFGEYPGGYRRGYCRECADPP